MIKTHAPGTLMLFGEHAVLRGKLAIAASANQYIHVTLTPRQDRQIQLTSALGDYQCDMDHICIQKPFQFVLACLHHFQDQLPSGCVISIESDFSHTVGLGSSAAVTVATVAAITHWLNRQPNRQEWFQTSRQIVQSVQGLGSGADVAAATFGGVIAYQMDPTLIEPLPQLPNITLIYSGSKTPTTEVVNTLNQYADKAPDCYAQYFNAIHACSVLAKQQIAHADWASLANTMQQQQAIMRKMQLSTPLIDTLIDQIHAYTPGAKISGSGLGDCIIALGHLPANTFPQDDMQQQAGVLQIDLALEQQGAHVESH